MALTKTEFEENLRKEGKQPNVESMPPIPVGDSPFEHDAYSMGIEVNARFTVMHGDSNSNYLIVVDLATGTRTKLDYTAVVKPAK